MTEALFDAARFEFRIMELDGVHDAWSLYPSMYGGIDKGREARDRADFLNETFAKQGRKFKVQRRALSHWQDV